MNATEKILTELRSLLEEGAFAPGSRFPSEADLADNYGVSKLTMNKIVSVLADNGYLTRGNRGAGTRVTEQLFRSAHESFDIFAVHPYVYPRTISPLGYDCANPESGGFLSRMDHIVKLIRQYGNKHELGVGELGWNLTNDADYSSRAAAIQAAYLARSSILMRTYPECRWSIWYTISNNTGQSDYGIFRTDNGMRPLPAAAAFAQVAHLFQGMQGGQAKRLLDDAPHYLVEWSLDGERRFALWTSDEEATPVFLSLPKMKVWNLYGSSLNHRKVPYTDMPVFLAARWDTHLARK